MAIYLLDDSLQVSVYFDSSDADYDDNICVSLVEECPEDEKILLAGETNIYLTPAQACQLAQALLTAAKDSSHFCGESNGI